MYVDLVLTKNQVTLEKSGWSLYMYVRAYGGCHWCVTVYVCVCMFAMGMSVCMFERGVCHCVCMLGHLGDSLCMYVCSK